MERRTAESGTPQVHGHKSSRSRPTEAEEIEDPVERLLNQTGCLQKHYDVQDCISESADWRKCQRQVEDFRLCIEAHKKKTNKH